jgi:hypothetical protein
MKPRLYLETTIPSYLVARRSRDVIMHGQQAATRKWWEQRRGDYELFVAAYVPRFVPRSICWNLEP